jgi:type VI secretion system protein ImpL
MKAFFAFFLNPWLLAALGLLALSLVIWFVGPQVSVFGFVPLGSETARWILIALVIGLYIASKLIGLWRSRQANQKVVAELAAQGAPSVATESPEAKQLRERFETALQTLRKMRFGAKGGFWSSLSWKFSRQFLYELPWYVIVGAPGAGKTTALLNSGLRFPLADSLGRGAIKGVGGTRNCDWWFTDQAVLIDTAGRYTTHEADPEADKKAWQGFLGLLKKARPRRPINGALLALSVTDLLGFSAEQRAAHAHTLRTRLRELHETLGIRMPVYVLVTKCDLLAGFMDYFADTDKTERAQVWGTTFDYPTSVAGQANGKFSAEFDLMTQRLLDGVIGRVQAERDPQRRARIYAFPQQFGGMRDALDELLRLTFEGSSYDEAPLLRGVYFVSGTQEGTPIDRMLGAIARELRLERLILPPNQNSGKSFFLTRLLNEVVFPEAELVGANLKMERRRRWLAIACYAAIGVVAASLLLAWLISYGNNRSDLSNASLAAAATKKIVDATPFAVSADMVPVLPALAASRALPAKVAPEVVPWSHGFGLYQGRRLETAAQLSYDQLLADTLPPRLTARIEQQLRSSGGNLDALYEALKAYIMLTTPERFESASVRQIVTDDWNKTLLSSIPAEERALLDQHLDAFLASSGRRALLKQDVNLVAQTRDQLRNVSLAQRIYTRLKLQGVGKEFPDFTARRSGGDLVDSVFVSASGQRLTRGVPGLYTRDGYEKGFKKAVDSVARQLAEEERWVLGASDATASRLADPLFVQRVIEEVRKLYLNDYITVWDAFINDIKLRRVAGLRESLEVTRALSAPDNPLVPLMRAIARETTLAASDGFVESTIDKGRDIVKKGAEKFLGQGKTETLPGMGEAPELVVDRYFAPIRRYALAPAQGQPAPIDGTIDLIKKINGELVAAEAATKAGNSPPATDTPNQAKTEAPRMPEPARTLVNTVAAAAVDVVLGATKGNVFALMKAEVGDFCRQAVTGRYPFVRNSANDVTREDFATLFAPGGRFDAFCQKNLTTLVDTTTASWTFRELGAARMSDPSGALRQFQRARVIRDTFFRSGGNQPSLSLQFKPNDMDSTITRFNLSIDSQVVSYAHGPQNLTGVQWPGAGGGLQARVELSPTVPGRNSSIGESGPWALFRLLDRMTLEPGPTPERFRVTFTVDGRRATYDVTTGSVQNPFKLREMQEFRCPE